MQLCSMPGNSQSYPSCCNYVSILLLSALQERREGDTL